MKKPRIYILPTRLGAVFIAGSAVMILAGASYQNNLVNLLAFFMLSLIFVAMVETHSNLKNIELDSVEIENGYAGQEFLATVVIRNNGRAPRFNIEATLRKQTLHSRYENVHPLLRDSFLKLRASYQAPSRGRHRVKSVEIASIFPLGLFRAWMVIPIDLNFLIYPAPLGERPLPNESLGEALNTHSKVLNAGDDFHGHRAFQSGDSYKRVDWKARARGRPLLIKEFNEGEPTASLVDWYALPQIDPELRLSQLTQWIREAKLRRNPFALRLPDLTVPTGSGHQHVSRCLEALALYGLEDHQRKPK